MTIAAHLIVGARPEPFLPALLESLAGVADLLLVNDNSGDPASENARVLAASHFAARGRIEIDRTPFRDFATARNIVLDLHRRIAGGGWAAFVDADEVHRPRAAAIASRLAGLPAHVAVVDGYTRHFVQSFDWYASIERRMMFFRVTDAVRWEGAVHEHLSGIAGSHLAVPYVYEHYGWVLTPALLAAKGRLYASLGQAGVTVSEDKEHTAEALRVFETDFWPRALRYRGSEPPAATAIRRALEAEDGERLHALDRNVGRYQPPLVRLRNVVRRLNFEYRWRGRALDPRAALLVRRRPAGKQRLPLARASFALARALRHWVPSSDLNAYERRISSQNGEDGIIAEIFDRIGTTNRTFAEFGVEDGSECNSAYLARECGWNGVFIEADPQRIAALAARYAGKPVRIVEAFITAENITSLFAKHAVPRDLDLLSIDIDGNDYWIWEALGEYRPRVVVIEYNPTHPPPERWVMAYDAAHRWKRDGYYGASLSSLEALGARLGYALIGTNRSGVNAFFVRDDLLAAARFPQRTASEAYHPSAYGQTATAGPFVVR